MARRRKSANAETLKAEIDATDARIAELSAKKAELVKAREDAENAAILKIVFDAGIDQGALRLIIDDYFEARDVPEVPEAPEAPEVPEAKTRKDGKDGEPPDVIVSASPDIPDLPAAEKDDGKGETS
jgi:hypothetical protein